MALLYFNYFHLVLCTVYILFWGTPFALYIHSLFLIFEYKLFSTILRDFSFLLWFLLGSCHHIRGLPCTFSWVASKVYVPLEIYLELLLTPFCQYVHSILFAVLAPNHSLYLPCIHLLCFRLCFCPRVVCQQFCYTLSSLLSPLSVSGQPCFGDVCHERSCNLSSIYFCAILFS